MAAKRFYPDSKVEIQGFEARNYDFLMNVISFGLYKKFIESAVNAFKIKAQDKILDLGCGTGRNACLMAKHLNANGAVLGLDISEEMQVQFEENCKHFPQVQYRHQRIDQPFFLDQKYDKAFISFVLHGFPQEIRLKIIANVHENLKPGGHFCILDFSEFSLKEMPVYYRIPFTTIECPYAFDFIGRDWKTILSQAGFDFAEEKFWFKNYVRLLTVRKK